MREYYRCLLGALREDRGGTSATMIEAANPGWVGQKIYQDAQDKLVWPTTDPVLNEILIRYFKEANPVQPGLVKLSETETAYVEPVKAGPKVLVLGGGHVSQALAKILALLNYETTIVDDRPEFGSQEIFPTGCHIICGDFLKVLTQYSFSYSTYVVIVTRGHQYDAACLRAVIGKPTAYIGMIGSKKKVAAVMEGLRREQVPQEILETVYSPVGIDIKAQTPAEIAVSISAQLISVVNRDRGERLDQTWLEKVVLSEGPAAVATLISSQGSTPRKVGARMLILPTGETYGSVGGGSGEAQVCTVAETVITSGKPTLLELDHSQILSICGGRQSVWIEPI